MFSFRSDNLPSVLFQPSLTVLSLSVGLTILIMRVVPQYSFYFFTDVLIIINLFFIKKIQLLQVSIPSMDLNNCIYLNKISE